MLPDEGDEVLDDVAAAVTGGTLEAAVGVKVPDGAAAKHEFAAASAAALDEGPAAFTVALPLKLQLAGFRAFSS